MASNASARPRPRRTFSPLHFSLQRVSGSEENYVLLGLDQDRRLTAKILSREQALAHAKKKHPDVRVPVDSDPDHDIIYVWNNALNEYVPRAAAG